MLKNTLFEKENNTYKAALSMITDAHWRNKRTERTCGFSGMGNGKQEEQTGHFWLVDEDTGEWEMLFSRTWTKLPLISEVCFEYIWLWGDVPDTALVCWLRFSQPSSSVGQCLTTAGQPLPFRVLRKHFNLGSRIHIAGQLLRDSHRSLKWRGACFPQRGPGQGETSNGKTLRR